MLTQKYKQQQQQVRVQTSESNYAKGMFFSDVPLTEGYSKVLVNWDIDSETGKLVPRKGLRAYDTDVAALLNDTYTFKDDADLIGENIVVNSKVFNQASLATVYNSSSRDFILTKDDYTLKLNPLIDSKQTIVPTHTLNKPNIHNKSCTSDVFFKKPIGTFAFNANYYYFLTRSSESPATLNMLARLPSAKYPLITSSNMLNKLYPTGNPGDYFLLEKSYWNSEDIDISPKNTDIVYYYNEEGKLTFYADSSQGVLPQSLPYSEFLANPPKIYPLNYTQLHYAKLGKNIQADDALLDSSINRSNIASDKYYLCKLIPQKLNPTEAASWGYNMLLDKPYHFECEKTATNTITILGILPYDNSGEVCLTPRKNQEITLKAYYRAPEAFHSNIKNGAFYATTKQYVGEKDNKHDPTESELPTDLTDYKYGDWWYVEDTKEYYMVMPGEDLTKKRLALFGTSKPAASVQLTPTIDKTAENKVRVHWQIRTVNSSSWVDVYNNEVDLTAEQAPFTVTTTMSSDEVLVKLTISDPLDIDDLGQEYILTTNTIGLSLVSDDLANTLNLKPVKYDLSTCTGMCEWEQRLVLWGVENAKNTVFVSDVNNPTFFPYPNNIDTFSENVMAVYPFGDELLVLTNSALYRLTWGTDGLGWTHTLVQQNLRIQEQDIPMCCVIKNMFFFKSREQYYMMVPKSTSVRGESTIAPISKPIEALLNNFHEEIFTLGATIADKADLDKHSVTLANYYAYTLNNKVVLNYIYKYTNVDAYLITQLIYDTDLRTWTMYMFEAPYMLYAFVYDALQSSQFLTFYYLVDQYGHLTDTLKLLRAEFVGEEWNTGQPSIRDYIMRYFKYINVSAGQRQYHEPIINNYQFLDTGNRDINTDMKKRFREFQFKIRNVNATSLGMKTSFMIDGSLRRDLQKFSPRYITDESTGEAVIVIERTLDNNPDYLSFVPEYKITRVDRVIVPESMLQDAGELTPTTLAESTDPDYWVVDQSAFPGRTFWKVRVAISGKGYTPRAQLLSTNLKHFEVLGHNWVYRTMHGR